MVQIKDVDRQKQYMVIASTQRRSCGDSATSIRHNGAAAHILPHPLLMPHPFLLPHPFLWVYETTVVMEIVDTASAFMSWRRIYWRRICWRRICCFFTKIYWRQRNIVNVCEIRNCYSHIAKAPFHQTAVDSDHEGKEERSEDHLRKAEKNKTRRENDEKAENKIR
eukprot:GHVS01009046.1.p1 GENE.GHVS01009046.1~~GHVS01009046.1.p1  ORF type:complete len:166 (-),score=18.08 GHVS01009046.1:16-513(-)